MTVVALRLSGPLQSWGSGSRFVRRTTEAAPTKSGVLGLVAAAKGLRRTDSIEELLKLRMGVRIDQPGHLLRDFQTARRAEKARDGSIVWKSMPLSNRYYLADATYLVVLEGEESLLQGIDEALRSPGFPLYLGRRSCPPAGPIALGVCENDLETALKDMEWQASEQHRKRQPKVVDLETVRDIKEGETPDESFRDAPLSFDPHQRQYAWRAVKREPVTMINPVGRRELKTPGHEPMSLLGG
jgi:CRISPR system Cascade subunit CasD